MRKIILFAFPLLMLLACDKEENLINTELADSGLLAVWKIESYSIDGVSQTAASCCEFLQFEEDFIKDDLVGLFSAIGPGFITEGSFEADFKADILTFNFSMKERESEFILSDDKLTIRYTEDNRLFEEVWTKNN